MTNPTHPQLQHVYQQLQDGNLKQAATFCIEFLTQHPNVFEAHYLLGSILMQDGQAANAVTALCTAIELNPNASHAFHALGLAMCQLKQYPAGIECFDQAIVLAPEDATLYCDRGTAFDCSNQRSQAIQNYTQAITLNPNYALAYHNRGVAQYKSQAFESAIADQTHAITIDPRCAEFYAARGNAHKQQLQYDAAIADYAQAMQRDPNNHDARYHLGITLKEVKRIDDAIACFDQVIQQHPQHAGAHYSKATALLLNGNLRDGFDLFEWRRQLDTIALNRTPIQASLWRGEHALQGKSILIRHEQGLGDSLQMVRFVPALLAQGARVWIEAPPPLVTLYQSIPAIEGVIQLNQPTPHTDVYCDLMSLPLACKVDRDTIPLASGYITPAPDKARAWKDRMHADSNRLRVGLVWAGGAREFDTEFSIVNARRNIPLLLFQMLALPNVHFYSLQKGVQAQEQLAQLIHQQQESAAVFNITDFTDAFEDFSDTAACIAHLDLVITVDTAVAHLAAAMAKPVWLLNRYDTCWRWQHEGTHSPWYDSLRIYRQSVPGNWTSVMTQVARDLASFTNA